MYDKLKEYITNGYYTIVQCQNILNNMYAQKQLSDDEYNELFEMSKTLEANNVDDALNARFNVINEHLKKLDEEIANIKQAIEEGGSTVPPIEEADGSEFNPIEAYSGLYYKSGLYYFEYKNDNQIEVYKCRDLEDTQGDGKQLYDLPSKLINVYFDWVRKDKI
ncbi:hypothetical protein [Thomasclavelia spiroformis]|uniref:hypothetical protein n=1 Tax=Thomasclavelia spiroformis TaxID=29348 RepID=UPI003565E0BD